MERNAGGYSVDIVEEKNGGLEEIGFSFRVILSIDFAVGNAVYRIHLRSRSSLFRLQKGIRGGLVLLK